MPPKVYIRMIVGCFFIFLSAFGALYFSFRPFLPQEYILPDAGIAGIVFSVMAGMLRLVVKYCRFRTLSFFQQTIIYTALGVIYLLFRMGLEGLLLYCCLPPESDWGVFVSILPARFLIASLAYVFIIAVYDRKYASVLSENAEPSEIQVGEQKEKKDAEITYPERITTKDGSKVTIIPIEKLIFLEAEGDYVKIHSTDGRFLKEQTMKYFENTLPPGRFVRIHRSYIVNIDFIVQIELYDKQNQLIKLKNGMQLKISRSGYAILKRALDL